MKTAVYCVSKNAVKLAEKINLDSKYNCDIYISARLFAEKNEDSSDFIIMNESL